MINSLLIKYGEIALRGKNREKYEKLLIEQLKRTLGAGYYVKREQGRFLVECPEMEMDMDYAVEKATRVLGIHSVCPCIKSTDKSIENILAQAAAYAKEYYSDGAYTFKVRTRRADKKVPISSDEISAMVGGAILDACPNLTVNVRQPEVTVYIELRNFLYIYSKEIKGFGGLPVSSSGKALCLLSGGIDSPVAAFRMGSRGVYSEFIYFHSPPYVSNLAKQKVLDLAEQLSGFLGETRLHIVPFTAVQEYLRAQVPEDKLTVFMKRSMLNIAQQLADKEKMLALIVGDSVGQVASQTLAAINAIDSASALPILRPLAGEGKQDTINLAKQIGTFEISTLPYEDCCTVFTPKHPETRPKKSVIEAIERSLTELPALRQAALAGIETVAIGEN